MNRQLSSGYEKVVVKLRNEDDGITLSGDSGEKLMDYLINEPKQFIKLTDQNGEIVVVRTTMIDKIIPYKPKKTNEEMLQEALDRMKGNQHER